MADCPIESTIQSIPREECIGNSLTRINSNFTDLKNQTCANFSRLNEIDSSILTLQTLFNTLSGITVPGTAKAWLKFDGTRDTTGAVTAFLTDRFIYSSYNVGSVFKKKIGDYRIYFQTPFPSRDYIVTGTSSETQASGGEYTWLQPYTYTTTYVDVRVHGNSVTDTVDPQHVSIVIY